MKLYIYSIFILLITIQNHTLYTVQHTDTEPQQAPIVYVCLDCKTGFTKNRHPNYTEHTCAEDEPLHYTCAYCNGGSAYTQREQLFTHIRNSHSI